ncbi:MAG: cell envelope integrity protein CreD [Proteobacteria bacterium]|nr:cell envelope integrity protein CreD [Pseudomonadota bacterium]
MSIESTKIGSLCRLGREMKSSVNVRLFIIGVLCLVLLIPAMMVKSLITEREGYRSGASQEISSKWGESQVIAGPVLTVPFKNYFKDDKGNTQCTTRYAHFLPNNLEIQGKVDTQTRYRGIYKVPLYSATMSLNGQFPPPDFKGLGVSEENVLWQDAFVAIGITDMKGIRSPISITWNGQPLPVNPGIATNDVLESGVSSALALDQGTEQYNFTANLEVNGSSELQFVPLGKETHLAMHSNWSDPSFTGQFLPKERQISKNGFDAEWQVLHFNRNYPQQWLGNKHYVQGSSFGTNFLLPVDHYQKTMRTAKYAAMFIALTFLAFFIIEILNHRIIHPVQYIMIGLALIIFYALLLSISEHISFNVAYLIASVAIIGMITAYTKGFLANTTLAMLIAAKLSVLYSFLFVVLQLQDYALLFGSIGLFVALGVAMYLTRNIDWYNAFAAGVRPEPIPKQM